MKDAGASEGEIKTLLIKSDRSLRSRSEVVERLREMHHDLYRYSPQCFASNPELYTSMVDPDFIMLETADVGISEKIAVERIIRENGYVFCSNELPFSESPFREAVRVYRRSASLYE